MAAEAPLPPLLSTPPRSEMLPLLPTPQGLILTMLVSAMPGRADFVQRWDWNKKPCRSICSSSSPSPGGRGSTGHADSVDRWDSDKKYKNPRTTMSSSSSSSSSSSYSAGSPGRADSVDRWDNKKLPTSCSASLPTGHGRHEGKNNRLPSPDRASSAERWDLHKKPRTEHLHQTNATATAPQKAVFAGASFYASPDPSMLPMPSFFLLAH